MTEMAVSVRTERTQERRRRRGLVPSGLPWILPALIVSAGLMYFCIGYTGYISTLDWNGTAPDPQRVGMGNFVMLFNDPIFWAALRHTVAFYIVTFVVQTFLGIVFAVLLHSGPKFGVLYKIIIFVPVVIAPAVMAPVFRQMFAVDGGFNLLLEHIGLGALAQPWLAQSATALPVIMVIQIWGQTGVTFILYFAAMSQIDPEILEAARIDGASNARALVSIIWPMVRGTTLALAILSAIGALKTFDVPYLVTLAGPNFATEFLGTFIYRVSIPLAQVGYGAAASIVLLFLALATAIVLQLNGRERDAKKARA
ncbi:carbohydrate ABC transporter permease [Gryllotalpicola protaetiae]|uniref:Sugar ABC transporter permease n=1 Tax=Gryllotalpicola protaetiae TaxID=2419771 RepID=A0A387BJV6_9MICO|nr:sugar ABC transporter permease [Gryllotalpicola protaetiae]AYG04133.1 sugar ABC transporter permease [Gryllotalpicola protaetiae]